MAEIADKLVLLPLEFFEARAAIEAQELDVLVYADMNSEPLTHFLGFNKLARKQVIPYVERGGCIVTKLSSLCRHCSGEIQ